MQRPNIPCILSQMKDSAFRLQDKSVLVYGDFNHLTQSLVRDFTTQGDDVGFVNSTKTAVGRFLDNVNDGRNVHPEYGRAAQIDYAITDKRSALEAVTSHGGTASGGSTLSSMQKCQV